MMKNPALATVAFLLALIIAAIISIATIPDDSVVLDPSKLDLANPVRAEMQIKESNMITVPVETIRAFNGEYCVISRVELGDIWVSIYVYLPKKDIATLSIGDQITVRGRMRPYLANDYAAIYVGSDIYFPPFATKAKLLSVNGDAV